MRAKAIDHSLYHKMHVLKRDISVSYARKQVAKPLRAQLWLKEEK